MSPTSARHENCSAGSRRCPLIRASRRPSPGSRSGARSTLSTRSARWCTTGPMRSRTASSSPPAPPDTLRRVRIAFVSSTRRRRTYRQSRHVLMAGADERRLGGRVLALYGPTASGKSAVAGVLRERLNGEVVSADSAALYAGIPILTAAPDYPVQLVGVVPLDQDVSVGSYQRLAHEAIDEIVAAGRTAIVVGGTGLYLRAALSNLELPPPPAPGERERWEGVYDELGGEAAHALLAERDAAAAARVHPNDRRRVVRALELAAAGERLPRR